MVGADEEIEDSLTRDIRRERETLFQARQWFPDIETEDLTREDLLDILKSYRQKKK